MEISDAYFEETMDAYCRDEFERVEHRLRANPWQATYHTGETILTILHEVAMSGINRQLAELLLDLGADPNARATEGNLAPLHYASIHGHLEIIDVLLQNGADIEATDKDGGTPLIYATSSRSGRSDEIVQKLLDHGAKLDLNTAIRTQRIEEVRKIIESDPHWKKNAPRSERLLHDAIVTDNVKLVKLLLDAGISPTKAASDRGTPLEYAKYFAKIRSNWDIVNLLRERGATK